MAVFFAIVGVMIMKAMVIVIDFFVVASLMVAVESNSFGEVVVMMGVDVGEHFFSDQTFSLVS